MTMSSERLIDAIFDLRQAITNERYRLEDLSRSAEDMGFDKLARRISQGIQGLEVMVNEVVDAHGEAQSAELRGHEQLMGNVLTALIHKATTDATPSN